MFINNDLDKIVASWHNIVHLVLSAILAFFFGFLVAWGLGLLWEVADGFKPWYTKGYGKPWIVQQLCYSDKFSLQDALIWDLGGSLIGVLLNYLVGVLV